MESRIRKAIEKINPYQWYDKVKLSNAGFDDSCIAGLTSDNHAVSLNGHGPGEVQLYLGASVINYCIRHRQVSQRQMLPELRYLQPVRLAHSLEMPVSVLGSMNLQSGEVGRPRKAVELAKVNGAAEYVIPSSVLHLLQLNHVSHLGLGTMSDEELIKRYRLSGRHPDYAEEIELRYREKVNISAESLKSKIPHHVNIEDLVSAGYFGLIESMNNYNLSVGVKFSTYSYQRIRGAMLDFMRDNDFISRFSRLHLKQMQQFISDYKNKHGVEPTKQEIKECLHFSDSALECAMSAKELTIISLDEMMNDENNSGGNYSSRGPESVIPDRKHSDSDSHYKDHLQSVVERSLFMLTEQERKIIELRYFKDISLKEIGKMMGLSESRICQIEALIMQKLRKVQELWELVG